MARQQGMHTLEKRVNLIYSFLTMVFRYLIQPNAYQINNNKLVATW